MRQNIWLGVVIVCVIVLAGVVYMRPAEVKPKRQIDTRVIGSTLYYTCLPEDQINNATAFALPFEQRAAKTTPCAPAGTWAASGSPRSPLDTPDFSTPKP